MYPGTYAAQTPDRIAAVMNGTGETLSYGQLEQPSPGGGGCRGRGRRLNGGLIR